MCGSFDALKMTMFYSFELAVRTQTFYQSLYRFFINKSIAIK